RRPRGADRPHETPADPAKRRPGGAPSPGRRRKGPPAPAASLALNPQIVVGGRTDVDGRGTIGVAECLEILIRQQTHLRQPTHPYQRLVDRLSGNMSEQWTQSGQRDATAGELRHL